MDQVLPMQFYKYVGKNSSGETVRGKIQASEQVEARERLRRMGIAVERFGEEESSEPEIPYAPADPSKVFGTTGKAAESTGAAKSEAKPQPPASPPATVLPPKPTAAPVPPATTPAPTQDSQTRLSETVEAMSKARLQPMVKRRKQKLILGEPPMVAEESNRLLEKCDGSVVHLAMHTDAQGRLKIAVVIEYDAQVKESKP
jgi:hypothetical protein